MRDGMIIGGMLIAVALSMLIPALRTGVLPGTMRRYDVHRDEKPKTFVWGLILFGSLMGIGVGFIVVTLVHALP